MDTALPAPDLARFTGRSHEAHRAFWAGIVADDPVRLPQPTGRPDPTVHPATLPPEAAAAVARISGGAEVGRFVVLLAAIARVLAAEPGGDCVLVDVPPLRSAPDGGELLPVALPLPDAGSVRDLLSATRDRVAAAFAHQDFPVRRLAASDLPPAPILVASDALHGPVPTTHDAAIILGADGLRLRHPAGPVAARALGERIGRALAAFDDTSRDLAAIELLSADEREAVRAAGEGPPAYPEATIWSLFLDAADRHATRVALRAGGETLTYAELRRRAESVAAALRAQQGVGQDTVVALVPARNADWIVGLLGILGAGAAYLPIGADMPPARRDAILAEAAPAAILSAEPGPPRLPGALPLPSAAEAAGEGRGPAPGDLAYVLYTSGSTGKPKGVMIGHAGFASMIRHQIATFGITPDDRVLQLAAPSFDASLSEVFMALLAGAALVLIREADAADPARFAAHLEREAVTVATITPAHLAALGPQPFPTLRVLITAGDVADPGAVRGHAARRAVFNAYGPTEVSVCATIHRVPAGGREGPVPVGRAVAGSRVHVLDRFGNPRPPGDAGEIVFEGPGVARGYLGAGGDAFVPAPGGGDARAYRTGDLGLFLPDGELAFLGRLDAQVKLRGHRVEPAEVAAALRCHPLVREAHVAPLRRGDGATELAAYVVAEEAAELWPSIAEFFVYDDLAYGAMAGDETRNAAYRAAFARHLPGKTVLEIGPGAEAVLSRMAVAAGARKVYAVEINPAVADAARTRLRAEGLSGRVEVITGDIATASLPETADVCISEIVGSIGGAEGSAVLIEASRRWLRDPSAQIPARSITRIAGASLGALAGELAFPEAAAAYVERIFASERRRFDLRLCLKNLPCRCVLTEADVLEDLDYRNPLSPAAEHDIRLGVTAPGTLDGFLVWLRLLVDADHPEEAVDILESRGSWLPVLLPLDAPSPPLLPGDGVVATVRRSLSANGLNPDFEIAGTFRRGAAELGRFTCRAPHAAAGFRATPLHRAAFDASGAPRRAEPLARNLRGHLEALIPGWMMPAHVVPLPRLPLNASGKVDRKALPEPPRAAACPAAPGTPLEARIAAVVAAVLGLPAIGTGDDFLGLGGDSIRAIQVAARLGTEGITLASADILAARTVVAMAPLARMRAVLAKGPSAGPFPLTPIQRWFLASPGAAPHHFNQSMLLRAARRLDPGQAGRALDALAARHDALRARFRRTDAGWSAEIAAAESPTQVAVVELAPEDLGAACAHLQASLDLADGPVLRAAILRLPDADRLLWVVHHLVVDWVSWAALLPDFEAAYAALGRGDAPDLPPPTDSFADWARAVAAAAEAPEWAEDEGHWRGIAEEPHASIPLADGEDRAGEAETVAVALDAATTDALLGAAARRHDANVPDLLLAALATAARPLAGPGRLRVMVEGHGRDALLAPGDVSRTVGWFTSFHPLSIPLPEPGEAPPVAAVRAARRAVPRNGLGYLLSSTRPGGTVIPAAVGLNYLGRADDAAGTEGALLRLADEPAGPATDPATPRPLPLELLAQVSGGRLRLALTFTPRRADAAAMRSLLDRMAAALVSLADAGGMQPAPDTHLAGLDAGALDAALSDWD